jgi:hypothetical protein
MKVKQSSEKEIGFKPFAITISFENEKECAAFFALFNHATLQKASIGEANAEAVKREVRKGNGDTLPEYNEFHSKLCNVIKVY